MRTFRDLSHHGVGATGVGLLLLSGRLHWRELLPLAMTASNTYGGWPVQCPISPNLPDLVYSPAKSNKQHCVLFSYGLVFLQRGSAQQVQALFVDVECRKLWRYGKYWGPKLCYALVASQTCTEGPIFGVQFIRSWSTYTNVTVARNQ